MNCFFNEYVGHASEVETQNWQGCARKYGKYGSNHHEYNVQLIWVSELQ